MGLVIQRERGAWWGLFWEKDQRVSIRCVMKRNILSWNVRGLGNGVKRRLVRELVSRYKQDIVIIQETKMENIDRAVVHSLCCFSNLGWSVLPFVGASGGILMFWNKEIMACDEKWVDKFSLSMVTTVTGDTRQWVLIGVYGPTSGVGLNDFIAELQIIKGRRELPWCIGGILMRYCTWTKGIG